MKRALALLPLALLGNAPATTTTTTISVDVTGLRNSKGMVYLCMTSSPRLFPEGCDKDPQRHVASLRAGEAGTLVLRDVLPGRYAIVLLHDENGNKKMDKTLFLPKEGFGFSRDAPVRMSAPKFEAAAFDVTGGKPLRMTMKVRYL
ncbi:conserved hypothetical protein [Novosphingobium aromaticivorans DSM 12444]|uniref:DUF2141 domain-containing protein n=1 Tax=Novosphingobium aromaticivorans (strain ATCC 700278 / DSM 12444 / CCUG 56034 / CIP 105152 / NBRC 16084 / F199) TaxID=279238 RepID=Q2GBU0_NOVAD|nr:DUF2141 domain-containing protein [Novosphingobium aromaticivorans]ABD24683.1 conserved hypothetical protein [Novosphingobium aromaticivorans DSM 12444]SCY20789.1 Uncharacterized conserved protein, DUF2141 family [Novosphingobium aromaticivorans]